MEQKHFSLLPATLAVAAALAAGTAQAETVHFDDPSRDFTTSDDGLFLATGDSTITAKDIALDGKSISASLSEGGELGAGSLAITANNARLGSYSQSLSINGTPTEASFSGKIDLSGSLTVANGVNIYLCKYRTNPALVKNKLAINATSIDISGGVVLNHETQGWNEGGVPGGLIDVRASADKIKIDNSRYWGISLGGNYRAPTDDEGVHLTLEANKMELSGGFAGPGANDIAVRVFRGAELNLLGKGERPELTITTNHIGSSTSGYFNKVALLNAGGKILVRYGEGSHLKFVGGIVTNADLALDYANSTSTTIETGPGSMFEMTEGDIAAARGPLTIRTKGSYLIDDAWISANESTLTLDLETSSQSDNGLLTGLIEMNPDGIVDLRVAGQNSNAVLEIRRS